MQLSFLNSNWYRKYPFKSTVTNTIPTDLLAGCRISTDITDLIYISKLWVNNQAVSLELSANGVVVGYSNAKLIENNQSIPISSLGNHNISGWLVMGNIDSTITPQCYIMDLTSGVLEESVVTRIPVPAITSLSHNNIKLTGIVTIDPTGLDMAVGEQIISFAVLTPDNIVSRMDKTAILLTCDNPVISGINTVVPNINGNIELYGIAPVTINVGGGIVTISTDDTITDVCKTVNIPPLEESNLYFDDITTTQTTEWQGWPQYNP